MINYKFGEVVLEESVLPNNSGNIIEIATPYGVRNNVKLVEQALQLQILL